MSIILRKAEKTTTLSDLQNRLQEVEDGGDLLVSLSTKTLEGTDFNIAAFDQEAAKLPLGPLELFTEPTGMTADREATFFRTVEADGSTFVTVANIFIEGKPTRVIACRRPAAVEPIDDRRPTDISLSWDDVPERRAWSAQLITSASECKAQLDQGNPDRFLNGYSTLSAALQIKFWAELLIAVAKFESDWNPHNIFEEPPPLNEQSVGLLQLSYQDQANYNLEPLSQAAKSLEDPLVNLRCGVRIFATLLAKDSTVASSLDNNHRGAARYWSVLRAGPKHHLGAIRALTKKQVGL